MALSKSHTAVLLRKNATIKRRQYTALLRCCKLPIPFSLAMEFAVPVAIVLLISWLKTLTDFDVITTGWGGDTPTGSRSTECVPDIEYYWSPAITSGAGILPGVGSRGIRRTTDCTPFSETVTQPDPFFMWIARLHWYEDAKFGLAADKESDVPKLQRMREWISRHWYPRHRMRHVFGCDDQKLTRYPFAGGGPLDRQFTKRPCHRYANTVSSFADISHVHGGGTSADMLQYLGSAEYGVTGPKFAFAVVFHNIPGDGSAGAAGSWNYSIRMNYTFGDTGSTKFWPVRPLPRGISDYFQNNYDMEGFKSIQLLFDRYIINKRADISAAAVLAAAPEMLQGKAIIQGESSQTREILAEPLRYAPQIVQVLPMPVHGFILNSFFEIVKAVFALVFLMMYMYPTFAMIATFIEEKESRVREGLRMMGVQNMSLILSWYILHFFLFLVLNVILMVFTSQSIFEYSSASLILVFLQLYSCSAIAFAYMIHTFFDKARTGAIVGALVFNCCYFVYASTFDISAGNLRPGGSLSVCLLSPAAFSFGISLLALYEEAGVGAHWTSLSQDVGAGINLASVLTLLIFDTIMYTVLGWYLEQVLPKEFGVRRPYSFVFYKSHWIPGATDGWFGLSLPGSRAAPSNSLLDEGALYAAGPGDDGAGNVEAVSADLRAQIETNECVQIHGLRRTFDTPDGEKVAVKNLTVNIYSNQIFALLGHNGAGKTTLINMLTGLYGPTAGDASVCGMKLTSEIDTIRKSIGVCPQHDVLFSSLTVSEHLRFYGELKCPSLPSADLETKITHAIAEVGLTEKVDAPAAALSGGQKRKLSLAIALIGEGKVVILDEPTSGMDPYSRRSTWNTLRAARAGRCMILTTHFMDEADLLGDRIAIMCEGELRCCGSSLFLKNRFGSGYTLTICKSRACNVSALQDLVLGAVRGASVTSNVGAEICFKLPLSEASGFAELFTKFEQQQNSLGIEQFGVSVTTMEEVFIRVAQEGEHALDYTEEAEGDVADMEAGTGAALDDFGKITEDGDSFAEFTRHFEALLLKRWRYGKRDKTAIFCTTILPVVMLLLGLLMLKYASFGNLLDQPALSLDLAGAGYVPKYGDSVTVPYHHHSPSTLSTLRAGFIPKKVDLELESATGIFGGVEYDEGRPTREWSPRSDRLPDYDPRHQPANKVGSWVNDPEPILAMSKKLMNTDFSEPNSPVFASLLVTSLSDGTNICGENSADTLITRSHSPIFGGQSDMKDCKMTVRAPRGSVVHLTFITMASSLEGLAINVVDGEAGENLWTCCGQGHPLTLPTITSSTSVLTLTQTLLQPDAMLPQRLPQRAWGAVVLFEKTCSDVDTNCRDAISQVEMYGITCQMTLRDVDVDTIDLPTTLPTNPATGQPFTEREVRQLAKDVAIPQIAARYGMDVMLADACPVSCNACDSYSGPLASTPPATPQFTCNATELQAMQTICATAVAGANFCTSPCYSLSLGPWLSMCREQADVVLNSLGYGAGILVGPLLRLGEQCEAQQQQGTEQALSQVSCWGGEYSEARCCDTSLGELGDVACWSGDFSFDACCMPRLHSTTTDQDQPEPVSDAANNIAYTILYNGTSKHATSVFSNVMSNSMIDPRSRISTYNHPLPQTFAGQALIDDLASIQAVLFITIAFAFVPGGIVVFVVREKEAHHNSKHQQMVSGVRIPSYWLSNWVWDIGLYLLPLMLSMLCIRTVGLKTFNDGGADRACFVLLAGFGWAAGPFTYLASFAFAGHTKAQIFTVLFNIFLGMGLMIAHYVMSLIESTTEINAMLLPWYRMSPGFCLGHGLWQLSVQNLVKAYTGSEIEIDPLSPSVAGDDAWALLWAGPAYLFAAILVDFLQSYPAAASHIAAVTQRSIRSIQDTPLLDEDVDVAAERHRISTEPAQPDELIRLEELRKVYGNSKKHKIAVCGTSFSVRSGEVLGYLGINGAGKTSTMKMLTGDILPTAGSAHLGGMSILTQQRQVRRLIGYCPQFDALLDRLTVREHLELFAKIRGVRREDMDATVATVLRRMDLNNFENKLAGTLSGGNKRKLSVGIALIGGPPIVFLDEPTTGVDPVARRFLWNVISEICTERQDCAVVLTTHVMEEVEALCTRVGIMVGGRLRCLGSIQHLKGRYGRGYQLQVKLQQPTPVEGEALAWSKLGPDAGLQKVLRENLSDLCEQFGDISRADIGLGTGVNSEDLDDASRSCEDESGWIIWDALKRLGYVPIDLFCEWWLLEDRLVDLNRFVATHFPGSHLVERHGVRADYTLTSITGSPRAAQQQQLAIADVFRKVEQAKSELFVEEYSVNQASLEDIFNQFASQQAEEIGAVRGLKAEGLSELEQSTELNPTAMVTDNPY